MEPTVAELSPRVADDDGRLRNTVRRRVLCAPVHEPTDSEDVVAASVTREGPTALRVRGGFRVVGRPVGLSLAAHTGSGLCPLST